MNGTSSAAAFALMVTLAVAGTGCDMPTSGPEWETRWGLPADATSPDVEQLRLPAVTATEGVRVRLVLDSPGGDPVRVDADETLVVEVEGTELEVVTFTRGELPSILGRSSIRVRDSGVVTGTSGSVTLSPGQELVLRTELDAVIGPN